MWAKQTDVLDLLEVIGKKKKKFNPKANSRALFHLGMYYSFRLMNTLGVSTIHRSFISNKE